jgi:23S rRNA (adenine2503-C2)-methyltransferase
MSACAENRKHDLKSLSLEELETLCRNLGLEAYRARQVFQWVFQKNVTAIDLMTNISKEARERLAGVAVISSLRHERTDCSADGSRKFLFRTHDGYGIESVLIPERSHTTLCISTQIGCPLQCRFCHTGRNGLVRNLSRAEIINQIHAVLTAERFSQKLPNLVFMGMGEPLANYENTVGSIRILLSPSGLNFSHRKITISTAGLIPQMRRLGADLPVNLAISLNAPNDELRSLLMPVNRQFPIHDLLQTARHYPLSPRKRITFEYILIKNVNDAPAHAVALTRLLKNIPCKINLIPFNEHPSVEYKQPDEKTITNFQAILHAGHFTAPVRRSKGSDIAAACGQLGGS